MRSLKSGVQRERFPIGEQRETVLGEIAPQAKERFPFYLKLPYKNPIAMLKWRIYVRKRCLNDLAFRAAIWEMCRRDVAFFAVTFAVIFEPRPLPRWLPFHLWLDQVSLLAWFEEIFGVRSGTVNKTRGIGLSWLTALYLFHKWLFQNEAAIAVLTKDKDLLDSPTPNSTIGKFQYLFDNLPAWAKFTQAGNPLLSRLSEKHTFINVGNGAVIQGFVSTSTKLRQLRFTIIFGDEFAFYDRTDQAEWLVSAGGCTHCMLMVSTWNGFDDSFHQLVYEEESSLLRMSAFWWNNYERWQGAYKIVAGQVVYVDKDYKHPPDYQFGVPDMLDEGMLRSPWVDAELSEPGIDRLKKLRDLYGMEVCSRTNSFFSANVIACVADSVSEPCEQGLLDTSKGRVILLPTLKSNLRVWHGVPNRDRGPYTIFCDLAHGVDDAFSVCCALDRGGEQVLEYGVNHVKITPFAYDVAMLARWLAGDQGDGYVLIDFEANGPLAKPFGAELMRMQYGNIHRSDLKFANTKFGEVPKYLGTVNRDGGLNNFRELERAVLAMDCSIRSQKVSNDLRLFGKNEKDDNKYGQPTFPRGRRDGHGDFAQAIGGAWWRARSVVSAENRVELQDGHTVAIVEFNEPQERWSDAWEYAR